MRWRNGSHVSEEEGQEIHVDLVAIHKPFIDRTTRIQIDHLPGHATQFKEQLRSHSLTRHPIAVSKELGMYRVPLLVGEVMR